MVGNPTSILYFLHEKFIWNLVLSRSSQCFGSVSEPIKLQETIYPVLVVARTVQRHFPSSNIIHHHLTSFTIFQHHSPSTNIIIHHHLTSFTIIQHHSPSSNIIHHPPTSFAIIQHHPTSFTVIQHPSTWWPKVCKMLNSTVLNVVEWK